MQHVTEAKKAFDSVSKSEAKRDALELSMSQEKGGNQKKSSHPSKAPSRDASQITSYKDADKSAAGADGQR